MDWTALTFGVLVTVIGTLFTGVALLVRRELDHSRDALAALDTRIRSLEQSMQFLGPLVEEFEHKSQDLAQRMLETRS